MYSTWIVLNPAFTFHLFDTHYFTNSNHVIAFNIIILIDLGKESIHKQHIDIAKVNGDLLSMRLSQQFIKWHFKKYYKSCKIQISQKSEKQNKDGVPKEDKNI